jgi:hypothetical protein
MPTTRFSNLENEIGLKTEKTGIKADVNGFCSAKDIELKEFF